MNSLQSLQVPTELGPGSPASYIISKSLQKFIQDSIVYIGQLNPFERFCIWRYTIGSASINSRLIFGYNSENATYWVYLFFKYWNNTFQDNIQNEAKFIPKTFKTYIDFFINPEAYNKAQIIMKRAVADKIIISYIDLLQRILLDGPVVKRDKGFTVYKSASKYPGLPDTKLELFIETSVKQIPFNSTTISSHFNFAPFISPTAESVLFEIFIPRGSRPGLYVPSDLHAYSFEHEIILPFGCTFDIKDIIKGTLDYIDPKEVNIIKLQDPMDIRMGTVYMIDEYKPCLNMSGCLIRKRPFDIFITTFRDA